MDREQIQKFLKTDEVRKFEGASWFYNFENNQIHPDKWEKSSLKILCAFLSSGVTRAVSNTYTQLDAIIRRTSDDIFVDSAYFPTKEDLEKHNESNLPYWFGNVSHAPAVDYDIIFVSSAILVEFINMFHVLDNSGIPRWHSERINNGDMPLIIAGGIPIADHDGMNGNSSLTDLVYVGYSEGRLPDVLNYILKQKVSPKKNKKKIIKGLVTTFDNIYYPDGYEVEYEGIRIKHIKPRYNWVPPEVAFHTEHKIDDYPAFERKIINPDGSNSTSTDLLISSGCSGGGSCYFCIEGNACGGWRERTLGAVVDSIHESLRYTGSNTIGFYSFNSNYYYRFIDLIYEASKVYSKLSLINMRTDMMAGAPEYFDAAVALGIRRASLPIEGFGERVRNVILNKSLTYKQIKQAFANLLKHGIMELKIGMIFTGQETAEDLNNAAEEFEGLYDLKMSIGSGAGLRCNVTPLVHFPHTGCAWMRQNTAISSLKQLKLMKPLIKRLKGKVRFKFNGQNYGTLIEQMTLNLGRMGTEIWEKMADEGYVYYTTPGKEYIKVMLSELEKRQIDIYDFFEPKPKDWIFPVDHLPKKATKYMDLMFKSAGKKNLVPCTKTILRDKPPCYECGYCTDQEMKDSIQKREIYNEKNADDIAMSIFKNKSMKVKRISFQVGVGDQYISKTAIAFSIASQMIRESSDLERIYHSTKSVSNTSMLKGNLRDWMHGRFFFDMHLKEIESIDWKFIIDQVNRKYRSTNVITAADSDRRERTDNNIKVLSVLKVKGDSFQAFRNSLEVFNGKWKVGIKARQSGYIINIEEVEIDWMPQIRGTATKDGYALVIEHSIDTSPHLILASIRKIPYKKALAMSTIQVLGYHRYPAGNCKCGGTTYLSELTKKALKVCPECISKGMLRKLRNDNVKRTKGSN